MTTLIAAPVLLYALWVFYLAVMSLKRAKSEGLLNRPSIILGAPVLAVGFVLDVVVNILIMTPVLLEVPEELTVTARLKRHYKLKGTWGYKVSLWFIPILEPYDPGHITGA